MSEPQIPYAKNMREVYLKTLETLAVPYPSLPLSDWSLWNKMTGGFRVREFTILCGSTGAGKTTFLANMSAQLLKQGVKHFVMSVETGETDFMARIMSALVGEDLNTGDSVPAGILARIHADYERHLESDCIEFSLYDDRVPIDTLIHDLRYMADEKGCRIAFIDNLNFFLEVTRSVDQIVEMDRVIHELIIFCKQVDIHIVMVMHPKKTDGEARVISEFDIKGSSTAVQEAHNVFLFNRPSADDIRNGVYSRFDRELTLKKMRRRGKFVNSTLVFENHGTRYIEKGFR